MLREYARDSLAQNNACVRMFKHGMRFKIQTLKDVK